MNTKGGVGKSTLVMALAETLSAIHGKNVLVVDSDSQTSMSTMLMHVTSWEQMEQKQRTLVDYLSAMTLNGGNVPWTDYVARNVSDVEEARSVYLVPSHMELSLFERAVSEERAAAKLQEVVRNFLAETSRMFDVVFIDCPPGLSLLTECWLREVDYVMPPIKPDYLSARGLAVLKQFRKEHGAGGFAEILGIVINMKDGRIAIRGHVARETQGRSRESLLRGEHSAAGLHSAGSRFRYRAPDLYREVSGRCRLEHQGRRQGNA